MCISFVYASPNARLFEQFNNNIGMQLLAHVFPICLWKCIIIKYVFINVWKTHIKIFSH